MRIPLLVVPLVLLATLAPAAFPAEPAAPLGAPNFLPSPEQPVGWRGDGSGHYPGATPPKEWYIHLKNCPGLATSASKPKDNPAKLDPVPDIALNDWIGLGAWSTPDIKQGLDTAHLPDELTVEPSEGEKAEGKQWKKLPMQNGAVNLADVFGESPLDPGQHEWDRPKQGKVAYAVTYVYAPSDGDVSLVWTHSNGYRLYLNGRLLSKSESTGSGSEFGGTPHFNRFPLKQGWNRLMLKSWGSTVHDLGESA